ncbi:uncharacterized protein LOC121372694 isoform X2 [Gigantopelta aegis]|uniref:uncharacterized protein LOC121372694 isoform X2 n=1 Tax=Gigantopelta aegis TaxID=1735272 RepID=UPI001B88AA3B|nr:uncharacterized protein LOC121372694 isoform X2 [Gigantopelta aegis]
MDQQEGSWSIDIQQSPTTSINASHLNRKRMNLIALGLCVLILLIYHSVKQDYFDVIIPSFLKGPQREQPTMFSGDLDDLPDLVVDSIIGRVITVDGVPYMWRPRASQDNCYKTCKDETHIECDHYFFDKVGHKCYMFGKNSRKPVTRSDLPVDQQQTQNNVYTVKRIKREINIPSDTEQPIMFSGDLDDLPDNVIASISRRVVTVDGVPYMWRPRGSQDNCFKTCKDETRIDCVRYLFDKVSQKCYMFGKNSKKSVSFNSLYQREKLPEMFFGGLKDLPQRVRDSLAGTVVSFGGLSHIWLSRVDQEGCYSACKDEKLIVCVQYFFDTSGHRCFLMGKISAKKDTFRQIKIEPKPFLGKLEDIPPRIMESASGMVITFGGIVHLWRPRASNEDCYNACKNEELINCVSYYFDGLTLKCIMMEKSYTKLENLASLEIREKPPWLFTGKLKDIPENVLTMATGRVISINGIPYSWRRRNSRKGCYTVCKEEIRFTCMRYLFHADDHKCVIMGKSYESIEKDTFHQINIEPKPFLGKLEDIPPRIMESVSGMEITTGEKDTFHQINIEPKPFLGKLEDIPPRIMESVSGMEITTGGITYIWRPRASKEDCYNACRNEELVNCVRYYFDGLSLKCIMMEKSYTKLENLASLKIREKPPWLFTGKLKDIPEKVLTINTGNVITINDIPYSWRRLNSRKGCYSVCMEETRFTCMRYLFHTDKCVIMGKNYESIEPVIVPSHSVNQVDQLKRMIQKVASDVDSVETLRSHKESQDNIVHDLGIKEIGTKRRIELLAHTIKKFKNINPRLIKEVSLMDKKQEALGNKVKNLAEYQKEIAGAVASVADKVSGIDKNVQSAKESSEKMSKMLTGEEFANPAFEREITTMRRQLMDLKSKIEINPTLIKMRKNQQVLGQALEAIDREITINERRLSHITDTNNEWGGRLMEEEENRKVLNDAIQALAKTLKDVRNDVTRLQNPQSADNAETTSQLRTMRSDLDMLKKSHVKLKQDLTYSRTDLSRLVKDLMSAQVSSQETKSSVVALVEANKRLKMDYHDQEADMRQMLMKIQVMATVYKNVLNSLHNLEKKQIKVMHHLGKFENQMHRLSADVLNSRKHPLIHNIPLIKSMKNFQLKLLKQVEQLKRDLFKIRNSKKPAQRIQVSYKARRKRELLKQHSASLEHGTQSPVHHQASLEHLQIPNIQMASSEHEKSPDVKVASLEHKTSPDIKVASSEYEKPPDIKVVSSEYEKSPHIKVVSSEYEKPPHIKVVSSEYEKSPHIKVVSEHEQSPHIKVVSEHEQSPHIKVVSELVKSPYIKVVTSEHKKSPDMKVMSSEYEKSPHIKVMSSEYEKSPHIKVVSSEHEKSPHIKVVSSEHKKSPHIKVVSSEHEKSPHIKVVSSEYEKSPHIKVVSSEHEKSPHIKVVSSEHEKSPDIKVVSSEHKKSPHIKVVSSEHKKSADKQPASSEHGTFPDEYLGSLEHEDEHSLNIYPASSEDERSAEHQTSVDKQATDKDNTSSEHSLQQRSFDFDDDMEAAIDRLRAFNPKNKLPILEDPQGQDSSQISGKYLKRFGLVNAKKEILRNDNRLKDGQNRNDTGHHPGPTKQKPATSVG